MVYGTMHLKDTSRLKPARKNFMCNTDTFLYHTCSTVPWRRSRRPDRTCRCHRHPAPCPHSELPPGKGSTHLIKEGKGERKMANNYLYFSVHSWGKLKRSILSHQDDTKKCKKKQNKSEYTECKYTGRADVVQGGGHVGIAVGARVVDRCDQRNLTTTRQELQKEGEITWMRKKYTK